MKKIAKPLLIGFVVGLIAGVFWYVNKPEVLEKGTDSAGFEQLLSQESQFAVLKINDIEIPVELARTRAEQIQGLSGRESLPEGSGLFFIFEKEETHGIWMKDMKFPIDIVWIASDRRIVHIEKNVSPDTYPKVFYPASESIAVLELSAGIAESFNIKIADTLEIY